MRRTGVHHSLKPSMQCAGANTILGQLSRASTIVTSPPSSSYPMYMFVHTLSMLLCAGRHGQKETMRCLRGSRGQEAVGMVTNFRGRSYKDPLVQAGMTGTGTRLSQGCSLACLGMDRGQERGSQQEYTPPEHRQCSLSLISGDIPLARG
jgi:hypothetical protein